MSAANNAEANIKANIETNLWRQDFPVLNTTMHGKPLVYLDNGASAQKPQMVIDAITQFYQHDYASVHRGVYHLSAQATDRYEQVRRQLQQFINAEHAHEVVFTQGTTESLNLLASGFAELGIQAGDDIIISTMEHHANIVPWQILCEKTGAQLKVININDQGDLDLDHYKQLLSARTRLVSITHVSNVLGTVNPVRDIIDLAHQCEVPVVLDGAQAVPHMTVDMQKLDCDFYVFSGHKTYGPTGIGVLYGKSKYLQKLPPYKTGGAMIRRVTFEKTEYQPLPHKFEAGTPHIAGVLGLGAAIEYLQQIGMPAIMQHETHLDVYARQQLQQIEGVTILAQPKHHVGVISFVMSQAHPHDIGTILDSEGVAVRAGHHCCMPLIERLNVPATVRVSLGLFNTKADIDKLCLGLQKVVRYFK